MNLRKYSTDPSVLSDQCKAIMSSSDESKYLFRVFAVNMVLSGIPASQVAGSVGLSKATVTSWVKRVDESGFDSLRPQQHPGRPSKLTEVQLNELAGIIHTDPTEHGFNVWDGSSLSSYIRSQYGVDIGIRQCQRVFRSLDDMHIRFPSYQVNNKNADDGLKLLSGIKEKTVKAAFFDPQYRGILDKLHYGNEGRQRGQGRCSLQQMSEDTIVKFIEGIDRVLMDSGHLFLWVDKYHLCRGVLRWVEHTKFSLVDMIVWDKGIMGMGYRSRRKSEYLIVFQKAPVKANGCWKDRSIPDVWREKVKKIHPHSKPIGLQKRLIEATTEIGDVVLDPAVGGYSVLEACKATGRTFIGCDIEGYTSPVKGSAGARETLDRDGDKSTK